jgi:hypothetical protein
MWKALMLALKEMKSDGIKGDAIMREPKYMMCEGKCQKLRHTLASKSAARFSVRVK